MSFDTIICSHSKKKGRKGRKIFEFSFSSPQLLHLLVHPFLCVYVPYLRPFLCLNVHYHPSIPHPHYHPRHFHPLISLILMIFFFEKYRIDRKTTFTYVLYIIWCKIVVRIAQHAPLRPFLCATACWKRQPKIFMP